MKLVLKTILVGMGLLLLACNVYLYMNQKRLAYFDYNTVYNNCKLKIKLEKDLMRVGSLRKSELDSLQMELSFLSQKIGAKSASQSELDRFEDMKTRFLTYKDKYEQENMQLKDTYFAQIRKEINDKARMFAEKEGYDYLFSAMGDGSLMYAAEQENVTEKFQKFIDK
jgi:Skp family chaperone for outer membrane proteins